MDYLQKFLSKNGNIIIVILLLLMLVQTCSNNSQIKSLKKQVTISQAKCDSIPHKINKVIKLEGLKSEKRMIQSTDRKLFDLKRENQLDSLISNIEKE